MPKVSVLIPAYDREDVIGRAIDSVLRQSMGDFELIVADDGSTDKTKKIIKSYGDDRVRYIGWKKNRGEANSRNALLGEANGEYGCWLDSDDISSKYRLELQSRAMDVMDSKYMPCGSDLVHHNEDRHLLLPRLSWTLGHCTPSCMFKMDVAPQFDPQFKLACTDMNWELNMISTTGRADYLPIQLYFIERKCKNRMTKFWKDPLNKDQYHSDISRFGVRRQEWFKKILDQGIEKLPRLIPSSKLCEIIDPIYAGIQKTLKGYEKGWGL